MKPVRFLLFPLTALLLVFSLAGCSGWHLRGEVHKPLFNDLSLDNGSAELRYRLEAQLGQQGVPLRSQSRYVVRILSEHWNRHTAAVDQLGREAERELTYQIVWQLVDRKTGAPLNPPRRIMSARSFAYYPTNITASSEEESMVKDDLYNDVAYRLVNELAAASRKIPADQR